MFGLAFACVVELMLAGWRIVRNGRTSRARLESDLQAIRSEAERISQLNNSTRTRVEAIGDTVIAARKETRSQLENLQGRVQESVDRVDELVGRLETLSKQVEVAPGFGTG